MVILTLILCWLITPAAADADNIQNEPLANML
jgi:hypothetical protein